MPTGQKISLESQLWQTADKLRNNMDAAEYKHVVLGLIFLKYISDSFEEKYASLSKANLDPEDKDEYLAENIFWVPKEGRWSKLRDNAKKPDIGVIVDDAMDAIEKDNPTLKGVLPKNYAREGLDKRRLGELIDVIGNVSMGDKEHKSKDVLGQVYEYFIGMFADAEGKRGGQFYTPRSIVRLLVEMLQPYKGRVYDPCCGSGGMFVQSEKFVEEHQGRLSDIAVYGQESNQTTWRLAKMNMALRGIEADIKYGDTLHNDQLKDLKADFVIANPPFNVSDWGGELLRNDVRWQYGAPPVGNANFAWVQHFIHHLSPNGTAGFVLSNSSLSATNTGDSEIRANIIKSDLVECIVNLPNQLFYNTSIPACLWFVSRNKGASEKLNDRRGKVLFIDARNLGQLTDKVHRTFSELDIKKLCDTYHSWRSLNSSYEDIPGFARVVSLDEIKGNEYSLSPNKYIKFRAAEKEDPEVSISKIQNNLGKRWEEANKLEEQIQEAFSKLGLSSLASLRYVNADATTLLDLNQALFEKWFTQFQIPTLSGDLNLVDSELGTIPSGWKIKRLTEIAGVIDCLHSKKPDRSDIDTGKILLSLSNISDYGTILSLDKYYISEEDYRKWIRNIELQEGDLVITNVGRVGAVAQIPKGASYALGRNITAIRPDIAEINRSYLIHYFMSSYIKAEVYHQKDIGTILDSLNVKGIKKIRVVVPPRSIMDDFDSFASPIRRLAEIALSELEELSPLLSDDEREVEENEAL